MPKQIFAVGSSLSVSLSLHKFLTAICCPLSFQEEVLLGREAKRTAILHSRTRVSGSEGEREGRRGSEGEKEGGRG